MLCMFSYIYQVHLKYSTVWIKEFWLSINGLVFMFYPVTVVYLLGCTTVTGL